MSHLEISFRIVLSLSASSCQPFGFPLNKSGFEYKVGVMMITECHPTFADRFPDKQDLIKKCTVLPGEENIHLTDGDHLRYVFFIGIVT